MKEGACRDRAPSFHPIDMKVRIRGNLIRRVPRLLSAATWAPIFIGASLVVWTGFVYADSAYAQWSGERFMTAQTNSAARETIVPAKPVDAETASRHPRGSVLGRLEVPRLKLSFIVLEGTDARTLDRSIGHVEGTGYPGGSGNIAIAGHRNTHFRKLEWIRNGDMISLTSPDGKTSRYTVEWVRLFGTHDMQVLDAAHGPAITLVTCFPFEYVGSAPLRYIVRALPETEMRAQLQTVGSSRSVRAWTSR